MPFTPPEPAPPGPDTAETVLQDYRERVQEREVRFTAQRLLAEHLRPRPDRTHPATTFWTNIDLDLTGATLVGWVLNNCRFRDAGFNRAQFIGPAQFGGAQITGAAAFSGASFTDQAWFMATEFTGIAWFHGSKFTGAAAFNGASFTDQAWFRKSWFACNVSYLGTQFAGDTNFDNAQFNGDADFRAQFNGPALFRMARFGQKMPAEITALPQWAREGAVDGTEPTKQ